MDKNKIKEGVSVKEIEDFARKYRFEVFFCLLFILACIFGAIGHFRASWSLIVLGAGAVLSIAFPTKVELLLRKAFGFAFKQDATIQIVLGVVSLIISIFVPFVIFFIAGCFGGRAMYQMAIDSLPKT